MKPAIIRARCSLALKKRVKRQAKRFDLEESDIVRMALVEYLDRHEGKTTLPPPGNDPGPGPKNSSGLGHITR